MEAPSKKIELDPIIEVEQALLGGLLMNPKRAIPLLPAGFSPTHYLDEEHRAIHEVIIAQGDGATAITVGHALGATGDLKKFLVDIVLASPGWMATDTAAIAVLEAFQRRELRAIGENLVERALNTSPSQMSGAAIAATAVSHLDALLSCAGHSRAGGSLDEALDEVLEATMAASHGDGMAGRSTGFPSVDEAISGLEPGTFNVLGARPGMGKTAIGCQIAVTIARQCKLEKSGGVLIFSLEMSKTAIARRVISEVSKLSVVDIKRGKIGGRVERLSSARHELKGLPLFIEDAGGQNVVAIKQKCRAAARRYKHLALILIDHIHIVKPDDADRRHGATQSVGKISNELRDISKDFDCPVLCLAQLNRGLFTREDKRPNLGDLRQAGDIEQDADIVMFLHREEVLLSKSPPERGQSETLQKHSERVSAWEDSRARCAGKAELIFEKVRDGAPCSVHLFSITKPPAFRIGWDELAREG